MALARADSRDSFSISMRRFRNEELGIRDEELGIRDEELGIRDEEL